MFFLHLSFL